MTEKNVQELSDVQVTNLDVAISNWTESLDRRNFYIRLPLASVLAIKNENWCLVKDKNGDNWAKRYADMVFEKVGLKLPSDFISRLQKCY